MSKSRNRSLGRTSGSITSNWGGKVYGNLRNLNSSNGSTSKYFKQNDNIKPIIKGMREIMKNKPQTIKATRMKVSKDKRTYFVKMYVTI
tara:strand:+ start:3717 stop:3983 length:267 start_codon:yes stop_codon:yes gene_type:complete